ncbi:MAG: hypothetical protein JO056_02200 [Alphaproteobacteria bacterium]|nr:hypothetical protein [Alphaproteobacteria bacterium]
MAYSFEARDDNGPIAVEDVIEAMRKAYKGNNGVDAMQCVAEKFQSLAANREFIRDALVAELKRIAEERNLGSFAPQSFIIHRAPPFSLRLNLWLPSVGTSRKVEQEARIYSYGRAHDHNFSLLTAGVAGPGYRTRIYEYDCRSIEGRAGEHVEMTFLEDTKLTTGKVMIYRPHHDIHVQIPPVEASMSLNLLIEEKDIVETPQYYFDLETSALVPMNDNEVGRRVSFLEAVGHFANEDCAGVLFDVARQNRDPSIRAAAVQAIRTGFPDRQPEIERLVAADPHPLVASETNTPLA